MVALAIVTVTTGWPHRIADAIPLLQFLIAIYTAHIQPPIIPLRIPDAFNLLYANRLESPHVLFLPSTLLSGIRSEGSGFQHHLSNHYPCPINHESVSHILGSPPSLYHHKSLPFFSLLCVSPATWTSLFQPHMA